MQTPCDVTLLRIYVGEFKSFDLKPLFEQILVKARMMEMAGATVSRARTGYGPSSLEFPAVLRLSSDRSVVIEIVDTDEKIQKFLAAIDPMLDGGLVVSQKVTALRYGVKAQAYPERSVPPNEAPPS